MRISQNRTAPVRLRAWFRANAMPVIAVLAAAVTALFVPPDREYLGYYDLRTLACLLSVLAVVGGFRRLGLFSVLAERLLRRFHTARSVVTALVLLTLLASLLLTNDTALLTFLPLSALTLRAAGEERYLGWTFLLQNLAANLGGMLTPFGNPQNLYLYSHFAIPTGEFLGIMLPPFLLSVALILLCCLRVDPEPIAVADRAETVDARRAAALTVLFLLAVAMVLRLLPWQIGLPVILLALALLDRKALAGVDWGLLLTFAAFFTFSGNLARMEPARRLFAALLSHGTMLVSALVSQVISNVPAAILLSQFTADYRGLLLGVNIGGAGTLVASLASLITFREYTKRVPGGGGRFLALFSAVSFAFLAVLLLAMTALAP